MTIIPDTKVEKKSTLIQIGMHAGRGGGVDRYFDGLLRQLQTDSPDCRGLLFSTPAAAHLPPNVVAVGAASAAVPNRFSLLRAAVKQRFALSRGPVVVASHFALYGLPLLRLVRRNSEATFVSHFHGPWSAESAAEGQRRVAVQMKRTIEQYVYRRSDRVIADSRAFADLSVQEYRLQPQRVTHVHAGMDVEEFTAASEVSRESARSRLCWPADRRIVLTVRRLVQRMGLERLIEAMVEVRRRHPETWLIIGGRGPLTEPLRQQIERLGLQDSVRLAGFISDEDLPYAYRAADLSIVPSIQLEGFGLVAIESLAAGTPVLVTPVGGMPEVVGPLAPQMILKGYEVSDLVAGLSAALSGEMSLPDYRTCVEYVQRNFRWEKVVPKLLGEYEVALRSRGIVLPP